RNTRKQLYLDRRWGTVKTVPLFYFKKAGSGGSFHKRLISEATYPAPNPLSMLTTLTLEAQEFIIPKSAARPLNAAPWPTLVGTAITGPPTNPPTTLGSA